MNKPKILFIANVSGISGAEIALKRFLKGNEAIEPALLLPKGDLHLSFQQLGYNVYRSRGLGELKRRKNRFWLLEFVMRYIVVLLEVVKVCLTEKPHIIHANNFASAIYAAIPGRIMRIPVVWHMHDIFPIESFEGKVCRLLGIIVDHVIAVSGAVKAQLVQLGINTDKISIIYNGVDSDVTFNPECYSKGCLRRAYQLADSTILIGMIGLLVQRKGFHVFIEAAKHVVREQNKPVHFFIVGDAWAGESDYKEALLKQARKLDLRSQIHFTGRREDISEVLRDLDIVVFASVCEDSLPFVILEAMAMQRIVIASKSGGVPEIIADGEDGLLYASGNVQELAEKILWVVNHFEEATALGVRARPKIKSYFREEINREAVSQLYDNLISGKKSIS